MTIHLCVACRKCFSNLKCTHKFFLKVIISILDYFTKLLLNLYIPNLGLCSLVEVTDPLRIISSVQPYLLVRNFWGFVIPQTPKLLSLRLSAFNSCLSVHGDRSDDACDLRWWLGRWCGLLEGRNAVVLVLSMKGCTGAAPARPGPATTLIKWTASTTSNCCIYLGKTRPYWHKSTSSWAP